MITWIIWGENVIKDKISTPFPQYDKVEQCPITDTTAAEDILFSA